ncbi:hypothetical protein [Turicibacter sp. TJ11]|uniref:hypothetical protein n=1 Tax=Turicibacter sp. TJ11 TaxID=2806443 RepID=UPI001F1E265E|nr:hypothetical protein [Turicibacter sp. TJ11]
MWNETSTGSTREFETNKKETVTVEIKKKEGIAIVHRSNHEQVLAGVRDNKVKIWNDLLFDPMTYHQIKTKMETLLVKKDGNGSDKSKRR